MKHFLVGELIRIIYMEGEPHYSGKEGRVTHVDDAGYIHGTWGGVAILPCDRYQIIEEQEHD
jgi:hypothetical protein